MILNECYNCKYRGNMCEFLFEDYVATATYVVGLANKGYAYSRQKQEHRPNTLHPFEFNYKCSGFENKIEVKDAE